MVRVKLRILGTGIGTLFLVYFLFFVAQSTNCFLQAGKTCELEWYYGIRLFIGSGGTILTMLLLFGIYNELPVLVLMWLVYSGCSAPFIFLIDLLKEVLGERELALFSLFGVSLICHLVCIYIVYHCYDDMWEEELD